jgi:hypothetical protein
MSAEGTLVSAAAGGGTTHQTFNSIFQLLGYRQGGSGNDPVNMAVSQGLGLRVVDSEHPISRSLASGSVYRSIGNAGEATAVPVLSGQMIAEQGIILGDGQKSTLSLSSVPAIVANSVRVDGPNGTAEGRTVHFNFSVNPYFGVSSQLFERSLMWISHSIAEEIKDAEDNNS